MTCSTSNVNHESMT